MSDNQQRDDELESMKREVEKLKYQIEINNLQQQNNQSSSNKTSLKTLKILSICELCIIPIILTFGIISIVRFVYLCIVKVDEKNIALKIISIIFSLTIFLEFIVAPLISLILAIKELKKYQ